MSAIERPELDLIQFFVETQPSAAARELERLAADSALEVLRTLPLKFSQRLCQAMLVSELAMVLTLEHADNAAAYLDNSTDVHLSAVLRCLPKSKRQEILSALPQSLARRCTALLSYSDQLVGSIMQVDIFVLPAEITVADALERIAYSTNIVDTNAIPVVDDTQAFCGTVALRTLLQQAPSQMLKAIIENPGIRALSSRASLSSVAMIFDTQFANTLPVQDRTGRLIGLLFYQDYRARVGRNLVEDRADTNSHVLNLLTQAYAGSVSALLSIFDTDVAQKKSVKNRKSHE